MKKILIYFGLLSILFIAYLFLTNYRQSPPIYYVNKYNFEHIHKSLLKPNDEDVDKMYEYFYRKNIYADDSIKYKILDSITNARITDRDRYFANLPLEKFVLELYSDSLVIVKNQKDADFVKTLSSVNSYEQLPPEYRKNAEDKTYNNVPLYFNQNQFPLKEYSKLFRGTKAVYFVVNGNYKIGIRVEKWDKYYSEEELYDSYYTLKPPNKVPDKVLFPYLNIGYSIIPLFIVVLLFPGFLKMKKVLFPVPKRNYYNPQQVVAIWSFAISLISLFALISVFMFEIDISRGGGAILLIGLLLFLTSLIVMLMYLSRTANFDKIYNCTNYLAKWNYNEIIWNNFIETDFREKVSANKVTYSMILGIFILITFVIMLADFNAVKTMFPFFIGFFIILFLIAILVPKLSAYRLKKSSPVCIITKDGLILGKQFHNWTKFGARIENVDINKDEQLLLLITYSYPARYGRQSYTIRVPIPPGENEKAEEVALAIARNVR